MSATIKTYKNYLNGAFVRSESNLTSVETYPERSCNIVSSTRKDLRNAVVANRKALDSYSMSPVLLKTQIIYRIAENLEARESEFIKLLDEISNRDLSNGRKKDENSGSEFFIEALNKVISLAGWPDKAGQLLSSVNPVSGEYFNTTLIGPVGTVLTFLSGSDNPLLKAIEKVIYPIISGNTVTLIGEKKLGPLLATFAEVLDSSDVPGGVINILTADSPQLLEVAGSHYDIDAIESSGAPAEYRSKIKKYSAKTNLKKCVEINGCNDLANINLFIEYKTIWQTVGY